RELVVEVIEIPANWPRSSDAHQALRSARARTVPTTAVLCGFIHSLEEYSELYSALKVKNLVLINSPDEYLRTHSFEEAYPFIRELTPATVIVRTLGQVRDAVKKLGLPIFIKGAVQSRKDRGWKFCLAKNVREAENI